MKPPTAMINAISDIGEMRLLLKEGRRLFNLSLREFAQLSGVSAPTLSRFERGSKSKISAEHYLAIFNALSACSKTEARRRAAIDYAKKRKQTKARQARLEWLAIKSARDAR